MNPTQFRAHVIEPTLRELGLWSASAERLMIGTALVESGLEEVVQRNGGPARSFFQIEPGTFDDIVDRYLETDRRRDLRVKILGLVMPAFGRWEQITGNQRFACGVARVRYWMAPEPLPDVGDDEGLAAYWKSHFNTYLGAGREAKFVQALRKNGQ